MALTEKQVDLLRELRRYLSDAAEILYIIELEADSGCLRKAKAILKNNGFGFVFDFEED